MTSTTSSTLIKTTLKKKVSIFFISDLHLGHRRLSTKHVITRILNTIKQLLKKQSLDYIMITGDVFDGIVKLNQELTLQITSWVNQLLKICLDNKIKLRVLEGTNTHDYQQSKIFVTLNEDFGSKVDVRYFDNITFVKEEDGLTYIAIPDNVRASTLITQQEVHALLLEYNYPKVDLMLTHGQYFHHVPDHIIDRNRKHLHDSDIYSEWVNYFVANGHIHPPSQYKKIETIGSFDRTTHGEEHPKGGMLAELSPTGNWNKTFIENKEATLFITKQLEIEDITQLTTEIEFYLDTNKKLQEEFLRVRYPKGVAFGEVVKHLKLKYPKLTITPETLSSKKETSQHISETFNKIEVIPITKDTIVDLVREELINNKIENIDDTLITFSDYL